MLDVFTVNLFRTDTRGRRVFFPFGRTAYVVSPDDEHRITRAVKAFYAGILVLLPASVAALAVWASSLAWVCPLLLVLVPVAGYSALMASLARSLMPLEMGATDLAPVAQVQRLAFARATGRRMLWALVLLASAMAVLAIWGSVAAGSGVWSLGAVFILLCTFWALQRL
jgi:hypothetical protein